VTDQWYQNQQTDQEEWDMALIMWSCKEIRAVSIKCCLQWWEWFQINWFQIAISNHFFDFWFWFQITWWSVICDFDFKSFFGWFWFDFPDFFHQITF
jgi:hypothetical protein